MGNNNRNNRNNAPTPTEAPSATEAPDATQAPEPTGSPSENTGDTTSAEGSSVSQAPVGTEPPEPTEAPLNKDAGVSGSIIEESNVQDQTSSFSQPTGSSVNLRPTSVEGAIEDILANGNADSKGVIAGVLGYIEKMRPGMQMTDQVGASNQVIFWRVLRSMVETENDEFGLVFGTVLAMFNKHSDDEAVFGDRYLFRWTEQMNLERDGREAFFNLATLMRVTADPKSRALAVRTQIDITRALDKGFTEQARQRILAFYGM